LVFLNKTVQELDSVEHLCGEFVVSDN